MKFQNRLSETTFLTRWLAAEPNAMFVYGPKSSGKSTLMMHVIEQLKPEDYVINFIDLRGVLLYDFSSFLNTFFQKSKSDKIRGIIEGITINTGFFSISEDEEDLLKKNPFKVMETQLEKARKNGKMPVLILDEIQKLKNIYSNGERYLIDRLMNLFVRFTKVRQLAHVILLTSDSQFIQEIHDNAKLSKTANSFRVDHLTQKDLEEWLFKEGFSEKDFQYVWERLGGCVWEIIRVIQKVKQQIPLQQAVQHFLDDEYSKLVEFIRTKFTEQERIILRKVHADIAEKGFAYTGDFDDSLNPLIPKMIAHDFWFFRTDEQHITANSESIRGAMKRLGNGKG